MAKIEYALDRKFLRGLRWRCIGPPRGGRVVAVAGHPSEPMEFYFGACAGGVWKTDDGGTYWRNVSDGYFDSAAIGAIAADKKSKRQRKKEKQQRRRHHHRRNWCCRS